MYINMDAGGFYTDRIGSTGQGLPVYLYFDPSARAFRPVVVPLSGQPYYLGSDTLVHHEPRELPPVASAIALGSFGAIVGGPIGGAVGAAVGLGLSRLAKLQRGQGHDR